MAAPFLALSVAALSGCLSRPPLVQQSFAFAVPESVTNAGPRNGGILVIRSIRVAAPFDSQSLIYRTGEFSYERDPYAQFLVDPASSLLQPLRAYFRASGFFAAVATPGSGLPANTQVEMFVRQLYGDFRDRAKPAAIMDIEFTFFDVSNERPQKVLFHENYMRRIPLQARTAEAVMAGWNQALQEIVSELNSSLRASTSE